MNILRQRSMFIFLYLAMILALFYIRGSEYEYIFYIIIAAIYSLILFNGLSLLKIYGPRNAHGRAILSIFAGLTSWFLGGAVLFVLTAITPRVKPVFAPEDILFLAGYFAISYGFLIELKQGRMTWGVKKRVTVLLVIIALLSSVALYLLFAPVSLSGSSYGLATLAYFVIDFVLVTLLSMVFMLLYEYRQGKIFIPWVLYSLAVLFLIFSSSVFLYISLADLPRNVWPYQNMSYFLGLILAIFGQGFFETKIMLKKVRAEIVKKLDKNN